MVYRNHLKHKDLILESLTHVGASKPIGYLPLKTVRDLLSIPVEALSHEARLRGIEAIEFRPEQCCISSGALYFYDPVTLGAILAAEADTLDQLGCANTPSEFVRFIAARWFPTDHPLMHVIRTAFGENENGRDEPGHGRF